MIRKLLATEIAKEKSLRRLDGECFMQGSISFRPCLTDYKILDKHSNKDYKDIRRDELSKTNTYLKATACVARIMDPLWKKVCNDLIYNMGPAYIFKIWDSTLGEISSQDKLLHVTCRNKDAVDFIQQYDFVILDSLQPYFPALKQVRAEVVGTLIH